MEPFLSANESLESCSMISLPKATCEALNQSLPSSKIQDFNLQIEPSDDLLLP
jgi:uncharacterized protein involved in propanediol utilization